MSTNVRLTPTDLVVEPRGLDRLWSFRRRLRIPLDQVLGATHDPGIGREAKGWRGPGLGLPGKLAGTFHAGGGRQFWNVTGYGNAVVITCAPDAEFDRVVVTTSDPDETERAINTAVAARRAD